MPQAILASEDPVCEEEVPVIVNKKIVVDEVKSNEAHLKDGNEKAAGTTDDAKEKSKRVESTKSSSSSKKSKNSYSIAALCQVNKISNHVGGREFCYYNCELALTHGVTKKVCLNQTHIIPFMQVDHNSYSIK